MNWDTIEGQWKQLKGQIKAKWAKLTDEDLASLSAKKNELVGKVQERYGIVRDEAERQVDEWMTKLGRSGEKPGPKGAPEPDGPSAGEPPRSGEPPSPSPTAASSIRR
jgi:uncharacterized protein YjbJ (UPF0337 family)